jgi:putative membrane protein
MNKLLLRWLISAGAIILVAWLMPGIEVGQGTSGAVTALVGGGLLGLLNLIVKPVLVLLSCPLVLLSLGLFLFVINAAMLLAASRLAQTLGYSFNVHGWPAPSSAPS